MKKKSLIPDETELHGCHVFNSKYYSTWYYLTEWPAIDYDVAVEYMENHNSLKEMNT